jgi:hypothetical protein
LRSLGWEVFVPKILPHHDPGFRSAATTNEYDAALDLLPATLAVLNRHDFIERSWSPTVADIVNSHFNAVVVNFSYYVAPLFETAAKFHGILIARGFGRESPRRYSEFVSSAHRVGLLEGLAAMGNRFIFGQGYDNIAEVEDPPLPQRARTITVPLPDWIYCHRDTWRGGAGKAIFLCPSIALPGYYKDAYDGIKKSFGDLPHLIFGRQPKSVSDPTVLPYLSDAELISLFQSASVFVYPSAEPRHIHYSPIEAIVVGTPVLYRRGALMDIIAGAPLPGACTATSEMRDKARRLIAGDHTLAEEIRTSQRRILDTFASGLAREQWAAALAGAEELYGS